MPPKDSDVPRRVHPEEPPEWIWELNGAGDPGAIWIDHRLSRSKSRSAHAIDAGFRTGTWVMRLTLPQDLNEVTERMHPGLIAMGLADAGARLEEKLFEAVALCRRRGLSWTQIGIALGVSRQAAWRRFGSSEEE